MAEIAEIIKNLEFNEDEKKRSYCFFSSLIGCKTEEIIPIYGYLKSQGIKLKPKDLKVLSLPLDVIKSRVEELTSLNEKDIYVKNPSAITSKGLIYRVKKLQELCKPYKLPNGNYMDVVYSQSAFYKKTGLSIEEKTNDIPITPVLEPVVNNSINNEMVTIPLVNTSVDNINIQMEEHTVNENNNELKLNDVSQKELTDEMLTKYDKLYNIIKNVLKNVYSASEVNDTITNNLLKIITNNLIDDDKKTVIFSIINGKQISDDEKKRIVEAINNEFEYSFNEDINLGRLR